MRKEALVLTGILLIVIAASGCVSPAQTDDGPKILEIEFMEGVKYTYDMAYADSDQTAVTELYMTNETPLYWEGIVTMKGEVEADNETHKIAHMARFRISKENFWIGMTRRLSLQDAVRTDHLYSDFLMNDISKPFFMHSFVRFNRLNATELVSTGKSEFSYNSWVYHVNMSGPLAVDDFLGYRIETYDSPNRYEFYVSAGEPYLLLHMNQDGLIMTLRSIELAKFRPEAWDDYNLFLESTTFNRSECSDYLPTEDAEELLGSPVELSSSADGNAELDDRASLVCVYDAEEEHIVVILYKFPTATLALEAYEGFTGALNGSFSQEGVPIVWEVTNEFGARSVSYTGGVTSDIRFISDMDPTITVTVASQRESVAMALAEKVGSRIGLTE